MKRTKLLFAILCTLFFISATAQSLRVEGFVRLTPKEPLEFALVALYAPNASQPLRFTYTDKRGYYSMAIPSSDKYIVEARYVGYKKERKEIQIKPESPLLRQDFELGSPEGEVGEVVVLGKPKEGIDKKSYYFKPNQIALAQNLLDLALTLPQVKASARTGEIVSASGDVAPVVLINGRHATHEELRSIPSGKIIRIDYFDIAPERYNTRGSVIDVVTKPLDDGHQAGVEGMTSPLYTDVIANGYYSYNRGMHRLKLFLKGLYRNTRLGEKDEQSTRYEADQPYSFRTEGISHKRLENYLFKTAYSLNQPNKHYLEIALSSSLEKVGDNREYDAYSRKGAQEVLRKGYTNSLGKVFTPVVDLYYDRTLTGGRRLFSNVVYTYNTLHSDYDLSERNETNHTEALRERIEGGTSKHSVIGQVEYAHPFKNSRLYIGTQMMYSQASFAIKGTSTGESVDLQRQFRDQLYLTWEGNRKRFFYRIVPAVSMHYASAHRGLEEDRLRFYFNPRALAGYNLPHGHRLRLEVETANLIPDLGSTTEVTRQVREGFFVRNNPLLQNSYLSTGRLYYDWGNDYVDLSGRLVYNHTSGDWITTFLKERINGKEAVVQQRINALYSESLALRTSVSIKPFGNEQLQIRLYAQPRYQHYSVSKDQQLSFFSIPSGISLLYQKDRWGVQGDLDLPYKRLYSYFISSSGFYSSLSGFWRKGSWNVRLALENLFVPELSVTENHSFLRLQETTRSIKRDNFWKGSIALTYYFSIGKEYRGGKSLENEDLDRGEF